MEQPALDHNDFLGRYGQGAHVLILIAGINGCTVNMAGFRHLLAKRYGFNFEKIQPMRFSWLGRV